MGLPTPRPVPRKPYGQFWPSIAWTTLELTINADGAASYGLVGASPFPRHWIYDADGRLVQKSGTVDFKRWFNESFGDHTPWGSSDSEAVVSRSRVGTRATAVGRDHGRPGRSRRSGRWRREKRWSARVSRGRRSTSSSTACSSWRSTATRLPRSDPGRWSGSGPRWRAACGRRPSGRRPEHELRRPRRISWTVWASMRLAATHRREEQPA